MSDLIDSLEKKGSDFDFFEALLLLEEYYGNKDPNTFDNWSGNIQFSANPDIAFPSSDIASVQKTEDYVKFQLSFLGLLGVSSPLPNYFTEYGAVNFEESCPLSDFLQIFDNRLYRLFYSAWKKYRPVPSWAQLKKFPFYNVIISLSGATNSGDNSVSLFAGLLAGTPRNADGLVEILNDFLCGDKVTIEQWASRWVKVSEKKIIGVNLYLGNESILGEKVFDRSGKFQINLTLSESDSIKSFIPGSDCIRSIKKIVNDYLHMSLEYDINIKFTSANLVPVHLGMDNAGLGAGATFGSCTKRKSDYSIIINGN